MRLSLALNRLYNTTQKDLGQVLELEFRDAANRYDGNVPQPHPHLVCSRCGRIDEVMSPSLHGTASRVADDVGYELVSHRFDVYGLCPIRSSTLRPASELRCALGSSHLTTRLEILAPSFSGGGISLGDDEC